MCLLWDFISSFNSLHIAKSGPYWDLLILTVVSYSPRLTYHDWPVWFPVDGLLNGVQVSANLQCCLSIFFFFNSFGFVGLSCGTWRVCYGTQASLQLWPVGSRVHRLSSWGAWAWLPCSMWDLSSLTKDRTFVSCIGRQILNHRTTREILGHSYKWLLIVHARVSLQCLPGNGITGILNIWIFNCERWQQGTLWSGFPNYTSTSNMYNPHPLQHLVWFDLKMFSS